MSGTTCCEKLELLVAQGFVERLGAEQYGTRLRLRLPSEIPGLNPVAPSAPTHDTDESNQIRQ